MLDLTQFLIFELGTECNLGKAHKKCPNQHPKRYAGLNTSRILDDAMIVQCARDAYLQFGFTGLVGWHYYNEPTLQLDRMLSLMAKIREAAPAARFVLWSNGTIPVTTQQREQFAFVSISKYREDPHGDRLDDRLTLKIGLDRQPCLRVFTEFIVDNYGNHHPCCYDWRGDATLGNVFVEGFASLVRKWGDAQRAIGGKLMSGQAPKACQCCGRRTTVLTEFDKEVATRTEAWRATL